MAAENTTISYEQRLQTQHELHRKIRELAENLRDQQTLRDQNTADLSAGDREAIQELYAEADSALLKARADVQTLRSKLETPTSDNPWAKLDSVALDLKREEVSHDQELPVEPTQPPEPSEPSIIPTGEDVVEISPETGEEPPIAEKPDDEPAPLRERPIQLTHREKNIQYEINQRVLRLKTSMEENQSESILAFLQDPRLALLQEQNFRHAERQAALKWLEGLEHGELVETATRLRNAFRKNVNPKDLPSVLGVSPQAELAEVRAAYRKLMRRYSMDLFKGLDTDTHRALWKDLNEINRHINHAYQTYNEDREAFIRSGILWQSTKAGTEGEGKADKKPPQQEADQFQREAQQSIDMVLSYLKQYFSGESRNRRDDFSNTARELHRILQEISRQSGESDTIVICNTKDNNNNNSLGDAASKHTADRFANDINHFPHLFAKVERGDPGESAFVLVITVYWEAAEQASRQPRPEQPPRPGWSSPEYQSERRAEGLQQQLKRATSIRDIVSVLRVLDRSGFAWTATKNGQSVERQPAEIIRNIEEAIFESKYGYSWPVFEQKLKAITHLFGIQEKVKRELMSEFCLRVVENVQASLSDSVWALQQLEQISFRIPVRSRTGDQYRDPGQILRQMGEIQKNNTEGKDRNLARVNELIVQLTSLGNLDVKLYSKIREGWSRWEKIRYPIPEPLKTRLED